VVGAFRIPDHDLAVSSTEVTVPFTFVIGHHARSRANLGFPGPFPPAGRSGAQPRTALGGCMFGGPQGAVGVVVAPGKGSRKWATGNFT